MGRTIGWAESNRSRTKSNGTFTCFFIGLFMNHQASESSGGRLLADLTLKPAIEMKHRIPQIPWEFALVHIRTIVYCVLSCRKCHDLFAKIKFLPRGLNAHDEICILPN